MDLMKKALIALLVLLILGGGGAAYYFLVMNKDPIPPEKMEQPAVEVTQQSEFDLAPIMDLQPEPEQTEFYVLDRKLEVVEQPEIDGLITDYLYKGEKVEVLEKQGEWARISDYIVLKEGGPQTAEWVSMSGLSNDEVIISEKESKEILDSYLVKSDDLKIHQEKFRNSVAKLISEGECAPSDFEELGGWVKSVKYSNRDVYFIYCGGLSIENKIYLDVNTNEIFTK
ncbi:SH3 domain-containing protein [Vibrio crassostreae]|uniref:SH3 domain-containing protein n=1 Tax=Vibrio crassostreae TaxID=246167 RepID=UPI000F4AF050|nr:SH3 domain-containing protein [Vibrio crassostreae]NOH76575.1 SH3 domain-containing protein [Vibrio crassostreae]NOI55183.1 SH3 domain-containing protein [Vibrio crassostreae]CAK2228077.1 SH3 domain-containing protein [Vibrio crassostreae]CAK2319578.1 SH3 domain-containing protein [Vibrio crassostreae]CAK2519576.1 SH3 domain-containing protein [Vibrio crassostreae]